MGLEEALHEALEPEEGLLGGRSRQPSLEVGHRGCGLGGEGVAARSVGAAGLTPDVQLLMPDVPFLCHFQRAVALTDAKPYSEITEFLAE